MRYSLWYFVIISCWDNIYINNDVFINRRIKNLSIGENNRSIETRAIYRDDSFRRSRYIKIWYLSFDLTLKVNRTYEKKKKNRKIGDNNRSIEYWNTSDISRRFTSKIALHKNFCDIFLSIWKWIERTKKKK